MKPNKLNKSKFLKLFKNAEGLVKTLPPSYTKTLKPVIDRLFKFKAIFEDKTRTDLTQKEYDIFNSVLILLVNSAHELKKRGVK